jgi:hypothetical protein
MKAILAKRAGSDVKIWPSASKDPAPEPPPPRTKEKLRWLPREPGSMGQLSACGWYSVCEIHIKDAVTFETWTRNTLTSGMTQLAVGLPDWREARKIAQADADSKVLT